MPVKHISEVLREFYENRARENLHAIANYGIADILDSGAEEEFVALMELSAIDSGDINRAQYEYLSNSH